MKRLLLLLCLCTILFGCSAESKSPPASSTPTETLSGSESEDISAPSEEIEYQEVRVCGYTAKLPIYWIIGDDVFFGIQEKEVPFIMVNTVKTDKSLDTFFSDSYSEETFIKQFSESFGNVSPDSEMDHDTYEGLETRSFTVSGMVDNKLTSIMCTLFDNPGGGIGSAVLFFRLEDTDYLRDYLKMFYTMEPSESSDSSTTLVVPSNSEDVNQSASTPDTITETLDSNQEQQEQDSPAPEEQYSPTSGERNALDKARQYLGIMPFSHAGLIEQLEYDGYSNEEATYGADNCGADWYEQALKKSQDYLDLMPFSYSGLIKQLGHEGYTDEEAVYGANNCGADWYEQAAKKAQQYLELSSFSRSNLIKQLEFEGFTKSQAEYGVSKVYD